jgi:hypothetical protein
MADEDAAWGNVGEVVSDDDDYNMDDLSEEDNEEEIDDNDDDDDDSRSEEKMKNMETFIRSFHIGGYDVELDNALNLDRSDLVTDRHTQEAYNKPDNWVERNRIGLERVKGQLQSYIDSVHGESFSLFLTHPSDNEEPVVWHESILDEYWSRLDAKMNQVTFMYIENVEMTKERLAALVAILSSGRANYSSTDVRFINANICQEGIIWLSNLVDACSQLHALNINYNRIDNVEAARCLSRSLKSHAGIRHLHLTHCNLGSSPEIILVILQSEVNYINLENNNIDSLGAVTIAEHLEGDPPIRRIDLDHNRLNDNDAILISHALKRNTNLYQIALYNNNFSSIGVRALLTCVLDSSSLNAISESNHTLEKIDFFNNVDRLPIEQIDCCMNRLFQLNRTQKIVIALQDKDSLLQYLANVPVGLMPEVLAYSHGWVANEHQHKQLNVLYSTMRWWNMPMLYSYHQDCVKSDAKRKRNE